MKIGIDARLINQTGVGRYTRNLIEQLQELDLKNEYTIFVRNEDSDKLEIKNLKFKVFKTDIKWHSLDEQFKFAGILRKADLDLVHFPYFSIPISYNKPFVVTIHDLILHHFPTGKASTLPGPFYWAKMLAYKYVISKAAKKAKKIIAVSNSTKDEIVDHLKIDPSKIEVAYEAVDEKSISKPEKPKDIKFNKYFMFVGNVYPHKNAETLIKAFEKIDISDVGLIFVGKEDYFYKRLKLKVKDSMNIQFLENISDSGLSWFYQNAEATVCPALMEGFGLPALEAMANKCLVIASDTPALREVCEDSAVYFNPKNASELAEKMTEVLDDRNKFKSLIEKGFKRSQEFSWSQMAEQTLRIYNES